MLEKARNCLLITAHPDDEILWAGGLLARFASKFTVICCSTPTRDLERAENFKRAMMALGIKSSRILPTPDCSAEKPLSSLPIIPQNFDVIVTHNQWGEYGHLHHRQINEHVMARRGSAKVYTFGHRSGGKGAIDFKLSAKDDSIRARALLCYDHVLPYEGVPMPKWQALLKRYGNLKPIETYDSH